MNETHQGQGHHEGQVFFFFYNNEKINSEKSEVTGAEIKTLIASRFSNFDSSHVLVLEGHGNHPDQQITDSETVSLTLGQGEGPKRFFTRPPADFGA